MTRREFWRWYASVWVAAPIVTFLLALWDRAVAGLIAVCAVVLFILLVRARLRDAGRPHGLVHQAIGGALCVMILSPFVGQILLPGGGDAGALWGILFGLAAGFLVIQAFAIWTGLLPSAPEVYCLEDCADR